MESTLLSDNRVLYRGSSTETIGSLKNLPPDELIGKTIVEKGFMSTSTEKVVAQESFSGNMQMTIEAPKGSHGLDISPISQYASESEILFQAGQVMEIQSAELIDDVLHIVVEIIE